MIPGICAAATEDGRRNAGKGRDGGKRNEREQAVGV